MRKNAFFLIIILSMQMLTGCWENTELNQTAVVLSVLLDKLDNNEIYMGIEIANTNLINDTASTDKTNSSRSTITISETGNSIMEIYRKLSKKISKKIMFSHCKVIVIGEDLAKDGFYSDIDFFVTYVGFPLRSFIAFTQGKASSLLQTSHILEKSFSEVIKEFERTNISFKLTLKDLLTTLTTEGIQLIGPQIGAKPLDEESSTSIISVLGLAVFNKDRLVGWINEKESREALLLRNQIKNAPLRITFPEYKYGNEIGVIINKSKTVIKPFFDNDKVNIEISINARVDIYENETDLDLSNTKTIEYVQKTIENTIANKINLIVYKSQNQWKSDIFGLGATINYKDHNKWETEYKPQWDKEFSKIAVKVQPKILIYSIRTTKRSLKIE